MICSGDSDAFGAPRLGVTEGDVDCDGDSAGVGDGDGDSDGDGVSNGCVVGEPFFLRCGEALGAGVGVGVSVGLADGEGFFVRRGDGVGDALVFFFTPAVDDGVVGVGVGDFFLVARAAFFFRCGVGVGVAKIFFSVCPREGSVASFTVAANVRHVSKMKTRRNITN